MLIAFHSGFILPDCKMVCHKKCLCKIVTDCSTFCVKKVNFLTSFLDHDLGWLMSSQDWSLCYAYVTNLPLMFGI